MKIDGIKYINYVNELLGEYVSEESHNDDTIDILKDFASKIKNKISHDIFCLTGCPKMKFESLKKGYKCSKFGCNLQVNPSLKHELIRYPNCEYEDVRFIEV